MSKRTRTVLELIWGIFKPASIWWLWLWGKKSSQWQTQVDFIIHQRKWAGGQGWRSCTITAGYVSSCPHRWLCGGTSLLPRAWLDPSSTDLKPHIQHSSTGQDYPCSCFRATWDDSGRLAFKNHTTLQTARPWEMLTEPNLTAHSHRVTSSRRQIKSHQLFAQHRRLLGNGSTALHKVFSELVSQLQPKITHAFRLGKTLRFACMMPSDTGPGFCAI